MPLFWVCLAFIGGIALSPFLPVPVWFWQAFLLFSSLCIIVENKLIPREIHPLRSRPLFGISFSLLTAALCLGACLFQAALPTISGRDLAWYSSKDPVTITGKVVSFPEESASETTAIVQAQTIQTADQTRSVRGKLELRLPGGFDLSYGDVLQFEGSLDSLLESGGPIYQSYLARRGIYNRMQYPQITTLARHAGSPLMTAIYALRERAQVVIYNQLPFPESALLSGILLGIDWTIPDYLEEAYRACGVLHIIAISGFNIALVSGLIIRLTQRLFSPGKAGAAAVITILLYTILVGGEPAVVRAAIMGSLAIPAHYFGRRVFALHGLVIVAAIMLAFNPFLLWDLSFQLSFLACLGLTCMVDPLMQWLEALLSKRVSESFLRWWSPILLLVVTTLTAQFSVAPVTYRMNPEFSFLALPANLTLVAVQPLLMALGGLSVIGGLFIPALGQCLALAAFPLLIYCDRLALHFGFQPGAEFQIPAGYGPLIWLIVTATLIFFSILQVREISRPRLPE